MDQNGEMRGMLTAHAEAGAVPGGNVKAKEVAWTDEFVCKLKASTCLLAFSEPSEKACHLQSSFCAAVEAEERRLI